MIRTYLLKAGLPLACAILLLLAFGGADSPPPPPNIVIIYADDMGYGDLGCQNSDSKIPTPYLDQLAAEGMRFTDAHSSSGICSPSRFALLTGTYHWRRQHDIVNSFGPPFFREGDVTLPQLLNEGGYTTACIGKWHLGWDWNFTQPPSGEAMQWGKLREVYRPEDIDWERPVGGGPLARGFDYYFGDGTINFPPYTWIENDRVLETPTAMMDPDSVGYDTKEGRWEFRPGPKLEDWNPYTVLPTLTEKAVDWIASRDENEPFFLYFALPSPHAPIIPNDAFDGSSEAGAYGDFVVQTDWVAGQLIDALAERGLDENTIVVFSSDNGPEAYAWERARTYGHYSMGEFRGLKRDVWEGGHHVPMIVKWPGRVAPGTVSDALISQIDLMATLTAAAGVPLPSGAGPDSRDFTPVLAGQSPAAPIREVLVHNTYASKWGIRKGDWLYIDDASGGHRNPPDFFSTLTGHEEFDTPGILFNMRQDPAQRVNHYARHPEMVAELEDLLAKEKQPPGANR
ncbi:arylsulfatase A-like enzyme [Lewinella marina]|uniref:Arylsulfatase n=1 Tax=Neolewinella marina TaxID=438751 RepID=A0A2G0CEQ9_9BACT|nr:arylsulfatase [Neolewinella marina]NJB87208.1 arylsulfatase A-like enzyme [Neolewinella marina]PHK98464.1 arylsulfatase [Neolewinella marina]